MEESGSGARLALVGEGAIQGPMFGNTHGYWLYMKANVIMIKPVLLYILFNIEI